MKCFNSSRPVARRLLTVAITTVIVIGCGSDTINGPLTAAPTGRRLSVGETTACGLDSIGVVFCWGANSTRWEYGASPATLPASASPVAVPVPALTAISGGASQHMCGIMASRQAVCWGRGQSGQLGTATPGDAGNAPSIVQSGGVHWTDIFVSRLLTCALSLSGAGYCWGLNQRGEIGNSSMVIGAQFSTPTPITSNIVFRSVVPGWLHSCGIATSGAAYCWGDNASGQLGIGFADNAVHLDPLLVSFTEKFEQLSLGSRSTCGITIDHRALCWGLNATGQLGDGTTSSRAFPTIVSGGVKFKAIALASGFAGGTSVPLPSTGQQASVAHTCALTESGAPFCWGWNGAGQVGDSTTTDRLSPVAVQGNLTLTAIGLGGSSSCGMNGNAVWCWGSNLVGQLGNGTFVNSSIPVAVVGPFAKP